jgi:hypothetical protein
MIFFIFFTFFIFLWLEASVTTLPLLLIFLTVILILRRRLWVFALAFLGGLIVDALRVGMIGETSIFLVAWLFLILLYERKYEIATIQFVLASSFFGSLLYLWVFGYRDVLAQAVVAAMAGVLLFMMLRRHIKSL